MVVLAADPRRGRAQQRQQVGGAVGGGRRRRRAAAGAVGRPARRPRAGRRAARRPTARPRARRPAPAPSMPSRMRRRPPPSGSGAVTVPMTVARTSHLAQMAATAGHDSGRDDGQHALLALARHDLPGLHARLAPRHGGDVDVHADAAARRGLAGGAGQPGAAEVLDPDHELRVEQLEARLDEALLLEGVAHLDAGSLGVVAAPSSLNPAEARTLTPPMPSRPVEEPSSTARLPAPDAMPSTRRSMRQHAHAQHVDERVVGVAGVEGRARRRRSARRRSCRSPRSRSRPPRRASGCRASSGGPKRSGSMRAIGRAPMVKMSRRMPPTPVAAPWYGSIGRGVVVALDAHGDGDAVAGVDHAGVLARPDEHPRALRRQAAQVQPATTCRSSARSTSRRTWRARGGWAAGPGSRRRPRTRRR